MRRILQLLAIILIATDIPTFVTHATAQDERIMDKEEAMEVCEEMPEFPGGQSGIMEYFFKNFRTPTEGIRDTLVTKINVSYVVEKDGSLSNIKAYSASKLVSTEAVRIFSTMPKWKPGKHKGRLVRVKRHESLSVHFDQ